MKVWQLLVILGFVSLSIWAGIYMLVTELAKIDLVHLENQAAGAPVAVGEHDYGRKKCELAPRSRACGDWCRATKQCEYFGGLRDNGKN